MIPLLLVLALLAAPPPVQDEPPDFGRFAVWVRGGGRVHLALPGLGIPEGYYGPLQARSLLAKAADERQPRVLEFHEVPLPNIPGRLRLFRIRVSAPPQHSERWLLAYFTRTGTGPSAGTGPYRLDGWSLARLRQAASP